MLQKLLILFVLAATWTQTLAQPNVVFLTENASRETNSTKSAIQKAISDIATAGTWNSILGASPQFTQIEVSTLSASNLASLRAQLRSLSQPSLVVSQINSEAVGIALSEENLPFVDLSGSRSTPEPTELRVLAAPDLVLSAAADFLMTLEWNTTIIISTDTTKHLSASFRSIAAEKGITVETEVTISSSVPGGVVGALPPLLSTRSNVLTVLAPSKEMKDLLASLTGAYLFDILWVPVSETTADVSLRGSDLTNVINAIFAVQVEANASLALPNPASVQSGATGAYFGYDAVVSWAAAVAGADNPNDNSRVVVSLRALSSVAAGTATGTLRFASSGERRGDISVLNYRKTGVVRLAQWQGSASGVGVGAFAQDASQSSYVFASGTNVKKPASHKPVFLIGTLWDTIFPESVEWSAATAMAVSFINSANFIPGLEFRSSFYDDRYTVGGTIQGAAELARQGVRAVVGGTSSTLAIAAQNFLSGLNIPFISGTATSDVLSDKVTFPFFSRSIAPDRFQGQVMSDLAKNFGWKTVCTLNYQGDYPTNLINQFVKEFSASGTDVKITRVTYTLSDPDLKAPMKALADAKCRVIFSVLSASSLFGNVWTEAKAAGLLGPGIQWIGAESIFGEMTAQTLRDEHKLEPQDLKGLLVVTPLGGVETAPEYIQFKMDYANWTDIPNKAIPDNYITHIYDAVWSLARAARDMVSSPSLSGQLMNSTAYLTSLRAVKFQGVTGNVGYDRNGDRTNGVFGIFQWTGNAFPLVGDWEGRGVKLDSSKLVFADGSNVAPRDVLLIPETSVWFSWGGIATISAFAALALLLLSITFIMNIVQRANTLIFKSSPLFLQYICFGLILLVASIFFWFGDAAAWKCHVRVWFGFVGFALAYGAMLAKNGRLWYLFSEPSLRIISISNRQLTTYLLLILGPQVILLVLWSSLAPFTVVSYPNAAGTLRYQLCSSTNDIIFGPISFAYMGILLLVGGVLSFKTRTLPDVFRESQYIALSTYNYMFVATICIIIGYAIASEPVIAIAVATVGILFGSLMQWGLLFVPKYYLIFFKPDVVAAMSNTTRKSVTSSIATSTPKSSKYDTQNSL